MGSFVSQSHQLITSADKEFIYRLIELAGRTCYKSENLITENSAEKFIRGLIAAGHESVLEHASITIRFVTDRGVSHELVRHRIASYSQESTRYCNYAKDKYSNEITFVTPHFVDDEYDGTNPAHVSFVTACAESERAYFKLLECGLKPQDARQVLNNAVKTEVVATFNMRSLRNMLLQRCSTKAHPQMRKLMTPLLNELVEMLPALFEDIHNIINKTNS